MVEKWYKILRQTTAKGKQVLDECKDSHSLSSARFLTNVIQYRMSSYIAAEADDNITNTLRYKPEGHITAV